MCFGVHNTIHLHTYAQIVIINLDTHSCDEMLK